MFGKATAILSDNRTSFKILKNDKANFKIRYCSYADSYGNWITKFPGYSLKGQFSLFIL